MLAYAGRHDIEDRHSAQDAVPSMKVFLGRLDDKVILDGMQKIRQDFLPRP